MTRSRLAATAALSMVALLVTTAGGEAQKPPRGDGPGGERYRSDTTCKTKHTATRDFAKLRTKVQLLGRPDRRPGASAFLPVEGAKVITKLIDLTTADGDNVVAPAKLRKTTNENGVAKAKHEFDNFGNYRATVKVKVDGEVVATDELEFGVEDRVDGPCGPTLGPT